MVGEKPERERGGFYLEFTPSNLYRGRIKHVRKGEALFRIHDDYTFREKHPLSGF